MQTNDFAGAIRETENLQTKVSMEIGQFQEFAGNFLGLVVGYMRSPSLQHALFLSSPIQDLPCRTQSAFQSAKRCSRLRVRDRRFPREE
jgi:hypothetical protein